MRCRAAIVIAIAISVFAGFLLGRYAYLRAEPDNPITPNWLGNRAPDARAFAAARQGLEAYRARHDEIPGADWSVREDLPNGLLETGWFHTHKGEVELKAQVLVWGALYRVDVGARALLGGRVRKTLESRMAEKHIQQEIDQRLRN